MTRHEPPIRSTPYGGANRDSQRKKGDRVNYRPAKLADLATALEWAQDVWEERPAPRRLHDRDLVADQNQLGTPRMSSPFLRYISSDPDESETELIRVDCADVSASCDRCRGEGRYALRQRSWRFPLRHALRGIMLREHKTWAPFLPRREWHPTPYQVIASLARGGFSWPTELRYLTGDPIPQDFAEVFALAALQKLFAAYRSGYEKPIAWDQLSESQRNALDAA